MKLKTISLGEVRNNWRKYIWQIQNDEDNDLCLVLYRRVNQFQTSKDKRFLCLLSGEQFQEMYRQAYGEEAELKLLKEIGDMTGNMMLPEGELGEVLNSDNN